jgi:N-methylhydantoinase B/oxoprolinase/acetone carboxylase alpha subunit
VTTMDVRVRGMDLKARLAEQERRIRETGCYEPDLSMKEADPVAFEVVFTKLLQTVTNAREVALQISASPATREQGEIIFGLYTPEGDSICLSTGLMIHVHTMSRAIKWMIEHDYERDVGFSEGDYFFNNDAFIGGGHPSDQMLITPFFVDGQLEGWIGGLTHVTEVGAVEPGSLGSSITSRFAEGLILPCLKIGEGDELRRDFEVLVERSVRSPIPWLTDNRAKLTGLRMIREAVKELIAQIGIEDYRKLTREYIEDTLRATREKVRRFLFPGRYREVGWRGITIPGIEGLLQAPCEMVVGRDGTIRLDFDGLSPAKRQPFQSTLPLFEGMLFNALIQHVFYDLRYNDGTFLAVELNVPKGSACNPDDIFLPTILWGPAYAGQVAAGQCVARAYYAKGYREEVHASGALVSGSLAGGTDQYGRPFGAHCFEFAASGQFAMAFMDGLDTAISDFNPEGDMGDAEIWEQSMPPIWLGREIRKDGGGFGKYRGGSGIHSLYLTPEGTELEMGSFGTAPIFTAPGMMGGYPAPALYAWIGRNTNVRELIAAGKPLPSSEGEDFERPDFVRMVEADWDFAHGQNYPARPLPPYSIYSVVTGDGSGYGDPLERDPALVARDLRNGVTTRRAARDVYGVVVDERTFEVDSRATEEVRAQKRRERLARGIPAQEYKRRARERVLSKDFPLPVRRLYADVLARSEKFASEFKRFWDLPDDYEVTA